ncbi:MAG: NifU N-terminal domain-containing protein [Actinomycetota bacterium]
MGEPVNVAVHETARPGVVRFETDRPLTGMGHRSYSSSDDWRSAEDPADELARALFERGGVDHVHVYGNVITVELAKGGTHDGIAELLGEMFLHYVDR